MNIVYRVYKLVWTYRLFDVNTSAKRDMHACLCAAVCITVSHIHIGFVYPSCCLG